MCTYKPWIPGPSFLGVGIAWEWDLLSLPYYSLVKTSTIHQHMITFSIHVACILQAIMCWGAPKIEYTRLTTTIKIMSNILHWFATSQSKCSIIVTQQYWIHSEVRYDIFPAVTRVKSINPADWTMNYLRTGRIVYGTLPPKSTSHAPGVTHMVNAPRPSLFFITLPLLCIIVNTHQRAKMG